MFGMLKRAAGVVTVEETDTEIIVEGVPGSFMENDITRLWKTSRITAYMFTKITRNSFRFPKFFAIDIIYTLEQLIASPRRIDVGKHTAKKIIDALYENTWLRKVKTQQPDILDLSKAKLFHKTPLSFQMEFLEKYNDVVPRYSLKGYMLAGAAGSGKTYTSMVLAEARGADHIIVVCPGNAVYRVWEKSILEEYIKSPSYWIYASGKNYTGQKYLICHYEGLATLLNVSKSLSGRIVIILDESHNLNEISTLRTQLFVDLCASTKSEDIIWASGTPIKALGSESIGFFKTIDPFFTDEMVERFKKLYGKDAKKATDILNNRLNLVSHKIEKKELNLLPPIIENFPVVAPNGADFTLDAIKKDMIAFIEERYAYYGSKRKEHYEFYEKCISFFAGTLRTEQEKKVLETYKRFIKMVQTYPLKDVKEESIFCNKYEVEIMASLPAEWKKEFKDIKSVIKYLPLKIQGECLGRVLGKKRMECILALSKHIDYNKYIESTVKKTLIFTSYVEVLESCKQTLIELGNNPLVVYGKTNNDLNNIIKQFEQDPDINPLVATYPSLSTAVPLVMADTMIMLNAPFRDYIHQQAISRIHRLGSDTQVYVYIAYLDTGNTPNLSTRSMDILKWSQTAVEAIMGIKSPFEIEEITPTVESLGGRQPTYFDIAISMEELGIEETFDFTAGMEPAQQENFLTGW